MRRIVLLGRGGAGKSTLAARLGATLALPVIELDKHFWTPDLSPTPKDQWERIQRRLTSSQAWVIDGDFSLVRCAWRAIRRSRENLAFWRWLIGYRRRSLPTVMAAIAESAGHAELHVLRTPRAVERLCARATTPTPTSGKGKFGGRIGVGGRAWSAWRAWSARRGTRCEAAASGRVAAADGRGGRHRRGDRL
jgi:adenylate kinase family enzyme